MPVKLLKKFGPYVILLIVAAFGYGMLVSQLNKAKDQAAELRRRLALSDSTRQIAEGTVARMTLEVDQITSERQDLRQALADSGRKIVFMARGIRILSDSVDVLEGIVTAPDTIGDIGLGGDFPFGPEEVSLGFVSGSVFCAECIKFEPEVDLLFEPKPLVFDIGLTAHRDLPWEVFVTLEGMDEHFRVEISQPPEIVDWLREAREPPCRSKLLGFLPTLCDPLLEAGAGLFLSPDATFPAGGYAQGSVGLGSEKFRLTTIASLSQSSSLFAGVSFRFK